MLTLWLCHRLSYDNQIRDSVRIALRKTQLSAKFHSPALTVTLFSKDEEVIEGHFFQVIESQKSQLALVELQFTIIHAMLDA